MIATMPSSGTTRRAVALSCGPKATATARRAAGRRPEGSRARPARAAEAVPVVSATVVSVPVVSALVVSAPAANAVHHVRASRAPTPTVRETPLGPETGGDGPDGPP
ncbi:hypothetical protein [Streptomyces sp. NPDC058861]|uniref:hypothetical protein n=1 Tax=Streptomyces sp. NPDC058861 TaxID=3346653 RepID=UPI0036A5D21B